MKKILLSLPIIAITSLPLISVKCENRFQKVAQLNSSQVEEIKNQIQFEITSEGKKKYIIDTNYDYTNLNKFIAEKNNEYVHSGKFRFLPNDKDFKKIITLSFPDVNSLFYGHNLTITFSKDQTGIPILLWEVGCEAYGKEGGGQIKLEGAQK